MSTLGAFVLGLLVSTTTTTTTTTTYTTLPAAIPMYEQTHAELPLEFIPR